MKSRYKIGVFGLPGSTMLMILLRIPWFEGVSSVFLPLLWFWLWATKRRLKISSKVYILLLILLVLYVLKYNIKLFTNHISLKGINFKRGILCIAVFWHCSVFGQSQLSKYWYLSRLLKEKLAVIDFRFLQEN